MTSRPKRLSLLAVAALAACVFAPWPVRAQAQYPSQAIRIVVPYAPGGVPDTVARFVGQRLQNRIGQSVVVENRTGLPACRSIDEIGGRR